MALLILSAGVAAQAGLKWESTLARLDAVSGRKELIAEFRFHNEGTSDAEIVSTQSCCGCTTAKLEKTRYGPGEKGVLFATFIVGERTGFQRKLIAVTERGEEAPTVLTMEVQLPEPVRVEPRMLEWKRDEDLAPKKVVVNTGPGIQVSGIEVTNPVFGLRTEEMSSGDTSIVIDPGKATRPLTALLRIRFGGSKAGTAAVPIRVE